MSFQDEIKSIRNIPEIRTEKDIVRDVEIAVKELVKLYVEKCFINRTEPFSCYIYLIGAAPHQSSDDFLICERGYKDRLFFGKSKYQTHWDYFLTNQAEKIRCEVAKSLSVDGFRVGDWKLVECGDLEDEYYLKKTKEFGIIIRQNSCGVLTLTPEQKLSLDGSYYNMDIIQPIQRRIAYPKVAIEIFFSEQ